MNDHEHSHNHGHGHENDQGLKGAIRYLRFAPKMWRSEINDAVLAIVDAKPSETVLDIGAGMGAGTVLAAKTATVVAVEPTPFLRRVLSLRRLLQSGRGRITVVDGAAEQLPVPDNSIDALWSVNAMHHWVDPAQAAAEIGRVLKPGGRAVLVDEDFADTSHPDYDTFFDPEEPDGHHHGFTMVDAEQMDGLLTAAGLAEVTAEKKLIGNRPAITVLAIG